MNFGVALIRIVIARTTFQIKNRFEIVCSVDLGFEVALVYGSVLKHHCGGIRFNSFLVLTEIALIVHTTTT